MQGNARPAFSKTLGIMIWHMDSLVPHTYRFGDFQLDVDSHALYHGGVLIEAGGKKSIQLLAILLEHSKKLVSHNEILDNVWGSEAFGVSSDNVNHYVSRLRKLLAQFEPGHQYIESVKGRGYIFNGQVEQSMDVPRPFVKASVETAPSPSELSRRSDELPKAKSNSNSLIYVTVAIVTLALISGAVAYFRPNSNDEAGIRRVIKDSQMFESLSLYRDPGSFKDSDLDKYWVDTAQVDSNFDRVRIRDAVKKLLADGRHYGEGTKCDQFEIQSVDINGAGDTAVVKTLEKWTLAVYLTDGSLNKNRTVGPYFVSYYLRKIDGRWLIEKSNTARINRPVPRLNDINIPDDVVAGKEFNVRVTGQDIEPETVFIEIMGPGCPEAKPCKVPHSTLLEKSKISDTVLENVPLTLASGNFKIVAQNGDSQPSNPVFLRVQ